MRYLTLGDLRLVLKHLLDEQNEEALARSTAGKLFLPLLEKRRAEIEALPGATGPGAALATELSEADRRHDALGAAVFHATQMILHHPGIDSETKELARAAQEAFVPSLAVLRARYADEAARAQRKRATFEELRPKLGLLALPRSTSLADWVEAFLDEGDRMGVLLRKRAEIEALAPPTIDGGALKSSTIGLLGRFRSAIRDEVASGGDLPDDYEARLFASVDELHRGRVQAKGRRQAGSAPAEAAVSTTEGCDSEPPVED